MTRKSIRPEPTYNTDGTITIHLNKGYSTVVSHDDADLAGLAWCVSRECTHVQRSHKTPNGYKTLSLGRVILSRMLNRPLTAHEFVDHRDNNGMNNTRANLRLANRFENSRNRPINRNNKSGYKGVFQKNGRWGAALNANRERIHLGYFDTPEEAHEAYCKAAAEYHGDFANFGLPIAA